MKTLAKKKQRKLRLGAEYVDVGEKESLKVDLES